ncbi:Odorant receptor co-receptor, partial [Ephemera danica]
VTYFALKRKQFYRTMLVWESSHSHPLFVESDVKHRALGEREMLRLMRYVLVATGVTALLWAAHPFLSTDATPPSPDNATLLSTNVTVLGVDLLSSTAVTPVVLQLQGPKLMVNAWYPWDPYSSSFLYVITYLFQLYWLVFCICQVNLMDTLFCSWLIYGCEQLRHLKEGMQGLMQLSASEAALATAGDVFPDTREASEMADNASNLFLRSTSRVFPTMTGTARVRHTVTPEMLGFRNLEPPLPGQNAEQQQELLRQDMV